MPGERVRFDRRTIEAGIAAALVPVFFLGLAGPLPAVSARDGLTTSADLLETLEVRPEAGVPLDPKGFGRWIDADRDGCDTANEVLIAASHPSMIVVEPPCTIISGSWISLYDRLFASDPAEMTVDHMVPLEEAWLSGAWAWTAEQRRDFANDLKYPDTTLRAVTRAVDDDKGSKDPGQWQPPGSGVQCGYADKWIFVKSRWNLSVDPAEYAALMEMLGDNCPEGTLIPERGLTPGMGPAAIIGEVSSVGTVFSLLTVEAYAEDGSVAGRTSVDADGSYELTGLAPGTYRLKFLGGTSGALDRWYSSDSPGQEPTPVHVSSGEVISGIDTGLEKPRLFTDIPPEHPNFDTILWAAVSGYITGYPDGTFRADIPVNRGSLSAILYRYAGSPAVPPNAPTFSDLTPGSDYNDAVRWVAAWGIDDGFTDGTFRPEEEITRRTLAVFLHRLADSPRVPPDAHIYSAYPDILPGMPNYEELAWLASTFVVVGNPDGSFGPDQPVERGAMARSLNFYRFGFNFPVIGTSPAPASTHVSVDAGVIPDAPTTASGTAFTDVPPGALFYREISWLAESRVSTGWIEAGGTRTYRPAQQVNRDQMAAFLFRLAGRPDFVPPLQSPFADVPTTHAFYKEISWLWSEKISEGWREADGTRTFRPAATVNRDQMAAFIYRHAGSPAYEPDGQSAFADIPTDHAFYKQISWLASTAISNGWTEADKTRTFRPGAAILRDQMAAFMHRCASND